MKFDPIGYVTSPVTEGIDTDWGSVISEIVIDEELIDGLNGLDAFSHVIVVFYLHQSTWSKESDLVRRPQGWDYMPLIGIFAQRAKYRPNPIGITAVRLLEINGNSLKVQGLDAIDGTPVLDIKPYFPHFDRVDSPGTPDWVDTLMEGYF